MKICPQCKTLNRPTAKFCGHCRATLPAQPAGPTCPSCGATNRPQAKRCGSCGGMLTVSPAQQTGQLRAGRVLAGRYRITGKVAEGGMGAVYRAENTRLSNVIWAVKEMSIARISPEDRQAAREGFEREADVLARLNHPNLARVTDRFDEDGRPYLVMEFVDGQTLEAILAQSPDGVDQTRVLAWADQLCDVLGYLHNQPKPIIYRDMKPSNVMEVRGAQTIKLIDFGIVRFFKPGKTKDTHMLGTPGYAAPEQYGKGQSDERTDIYALGVTLLVLLTGYDPEGPAHQPFQFPPARSVNSAVSRELERVLQQAMEPNRDNRFASAQELRQALRACPGAPQTSISSSAPAPLQPAPQPVPPVPQPASSASSGPQLAVDTRHLDLGGVRRGKPVQGQFQIWNVGVGTLQARMFTAEEWVRTTPDRVNSNNDTVEVQLQTAGLKLGNFQRKPPDYHQRIRDRARDWSADLVRRHRQSDAAKALAWSVNAAAIGAGAIVQAFVWATYWHARHLVPAETQIYQTVEVRSNGGRTNVDVRATVEPDRSTLFIGWALTIAAVAVEAIVAIIILATLVMLGISAL